MDIVLYDLLVYKVKIPIRITLNKCFLKTIDWMFFLEQGEGGQQKGKWGWESKMSFL